MRQIANLSDRYGFSVLEDASHAIGGRYQHEPVGNCRYSAISVFSFHPVKIITTGEGGIATTNDPHLAQRIADLRCHGITKDAQRFELSAQGPWGYEQQALGFNYRMTDLQAALGLSQLKRLSQIVSERNRQFQILRRASVRSSCSVVEGSENVRSSFHLAVIRLSNPSPGLHRSVFEGLRAANIGVQLHYSPVHLHPYYRRLGFREGDYVEPRLMPLMPSVSLCSRLAGSRTKSCGGITGFVARNVTKIPQLCLGTVQFGMPYGVTNQGGVFRNQRYAEFWLLQLNQESSCWIRHRAMAAPKAVLRNCWPTDSPRRLISKLSARVPPDRWEGSLMSSLQRLHASSLDGFLVHCASDLRGSRVLNYFIGWKAFETVGW